MCERMVTGGLRRFRDMLAKAFLWLLPLFRASYLNCGPPKNMEQKINTYHFFVCKCFLAMKPLRMLQVESRFWQALESEVEIDCIAC